MEGCSGVVFGVVCFGVVFGVVCFGSVCCVVAPFVIQYWLSKLSGRERFWRVTLVGICVSDELAGFRAAWCEWCWTELLW